MISENAPKSTNAIMKQGQTAGEFGNDPNKTALGKVNDTPRDLSPK